ncbi:cytochrome P450 [Melanogaster broomeanus]|nr:cytochrome P450 [Melanogaster broomeanus]
MARQAASVSNASRVETHDQWIIKLRTLRDSGQEVPGRSCHQEWHPLPPGPPPRWFWESPFPPSNISRTLGDWVAKYGPVISLRAGSQVTIVIGRLDAATKIMEKEGGALVDRPRSVAFGEIISNNMHIGVMRSGERFRLLRKAVHTHLQPRAAEAYEGLQCEHARDVILDILRDPKHHVEHVKRFSVSVILRVIYGKSTPTFNDDPEVVRMRQSLKNSESVLLRPGSHLVDIFPILKYVPGFARDLRKYHEFELSLYRDQLGRVKDEMSRKEAGPSFTRTLLENADHRLSYDEMAYLAGSLFGAGSDTTSVAIASFIPAAACHPEAQARVQEELDMVVGRDRAPTFEDWSRLPQLHAFMSEALRWRPVSPTGVTHRATEDIIWNGQIIPAGATVLGCHWAISRDPVAYPDPEKFNPQRWLDSNGQLRTDLWFYTYGFGRRVCPGLHIANRFVYINLALLLWSFRIAERPDAPIDMDSYAEILISRPTSFELDFVPRMEVESLRQMIERGM